MGTYEFLSNKYGTATITPAQLAKEMNGHPVRVRELCRNGSIKAVRIGNRWAVPLASAAAFLEGVTV